MRRVLKSVDGGSQRAYLFPSVAGAAQPRASPSSIQQDAIARLCAVTPVRPARARVDQPQVAPVSSISLDRRPPHRLGMAQFDPSWIARTLKMPSLLRLSHAFSVNYS